MRLILLQIGLIVNRVTIIILLFFFSFEVHAQKYLGVNGEISFYSEALLEDITAVNKKVSAVYDATTTELGFQLYINDFVFPNGLMQDHFNENYLESDIYPKSTFLGNIIEIKDEEAVVEGNLSIHGKTKKIKLRGMFLNNQNSIYIQAKFNVELKDYNIKVPKIVMYKIAESIDITVKIELNEIR